MKAKIWSPAEIKKLRKIYDKKPSWVTDYELSGRVAAQFHRSPESVRWQLRQFRKESFAVMPPKILLLDIETLPINANIWGTWKQDVHPQQIKKDWSIACWAAKWLFDDTVYGERVTSAEAVARTDNSVLEGIWEMIDEAQVVIAHNGNEFDLKRLNTRFLLGGFPPPSYYKAVDTLKVLREKFAFTYNKMDYVNAVLGIGTKMETSYEWWDEAASGSNKYLDMMLDYNKQDVNILEELYLRIRPWVSGHPNMAIYSVHQDTAICPTCGSTNLHWSGTYSTALGLYRAFRCQDCGSIGRSTKKQYKVGKAVAQN